MNAVCRYAILWLTCSLTLLVSGQTSEVQFENISARHGTLHKLVSAVMEDHFGFMWFATEVGLFRYDGLELKQYGHDVIDSSSLSSLGIHNVGEDQEGRIWVSTVYGIHLLDRRTGVFERFLPDSEKRSTKGGNYINYVFVDRSNRLWVTGPQGLFIFNTKSHVFKQLHQAGEPEAQHSIRTISESISGSLWLGASDGLFTIPPGDSTYVPVPLIAENGTVYQGTIYEISGGANDDLWLATSDGLRCYNTSSHTLKEGMLPDSLSKRRVIAICRTARGDLWLAFADKGIGLLQHNGAFRHFTHSDENVTSIQSNTVYCIREDRLGNIWLGTSTGISKITADHSGFALIQNSNGINKLANHVKRIHRDHLGQLWTQTEQGIFVKVPGADHSERVQIADDNARLKTGEWIYEDAAGNIWLPVEGRGLWKARSGSRNFAPVPVEALRGVSRVDKILEDNHNPNLVWLGTTSGLCALQTRTLECTCYAPKDQLDSINTDRVIIFDQVGDDIWLYNTYNNSLSRFSKSEGRFTLIRPPEGKQHVLEGVVRDIGITSDSTIWIATSYGLTRYHIPDNAFEIYTTAQGIPESSLNAVIIDHKEQIWVSGNAFIARFDPVEGEFRTYNTVKPVHSFWSKARFIDGNGRIYFGSLNGIYTYHPDSIQTARTTPSMVLTDFRINGATYQPDTAFEYVSAIRLSHRQNDIAFSFTGIYLTDPDANQYRCRLEGYDRAWRDLGHSHSVNYTNLSPGEYHFEAQAANRGGTWNKKGLSLNLFIAPPFTQTGWFRAMLALVIALLCYAVFRIWHYQQTLRRDKKLAESAAEYRLQFLSHVSHEIRTPLNAIVGLSGLAADTKLNPQQQQYISAIDQSSKDLLKIINQLLDHSKMDSGMFAFSSHPFVLTEITRQLQMLLEPLALEKGLQLSIHVAPDVPVNLLGDGLRLTQILTNLLGNAIKFTNSGHVTLEVAADSAPTPRKVLKFTVTDTGSGIPAEMLDRIYERFVDHQKENSQIGTGLGLFITRQLIERQGGTIHIDSIVDQGTHVVVRMPFEVSAQPKLVDTPSPPEHISTSATDLRILVVDDAPLNHLVVTEMIKKRIPGAKMTTADSGKAALDLLSANRYDVIIMDARMPGMDGCETTRRIRKMDGEIGSTPILGATAGAMAEQIRECLDSGMNDVITKPIKIDVLIEKLLSLTQN